MTSVFSKTFHLALTFWLTLSSFTPSMRILPRMGPFQSRKVKCLLENPYRQALECGRHQDITGNSKEI